MNNKRLHELYAEQLGKASDKWSLYLHEYDRLLNEYRDKKINLLEIGIQNGGSLEIWSKYFPDANIIIGCDINEKCLNLDYNDPRIKVVVGHVNAESTEQHIRQLSTQFDIIIDDGSHVSSDIVKSFALYFPYIANGGVFIIEDLHCSYWNQLQGGLFYPYSSISFFKRLVDVINHEHWNIPRHREEVLRGILTKYDCQINDETLSQIHSIEFINSMCVVHKASPENNGLNRRVVVGSIEQVLPGHLKLHDQPYTPDPDQDQASNPWSTRIIPPDEAIEDMELALITEKEQVAGLLSAVNERSEQITDLNKVIDAYKNSTSWKITKPIRFAGSTARKMKKILFYSGALVFNLTELRKIIPKLKDKQLTDYEHQLKLLQSPEYLDAYSKTQGVSPVFLKSLVILGTKFFQWTSAPYTRKLLSRVFPHVFNNQNRIISYKQWCKIEQAQLKAELPEIMQHINLMLHKPVFTIAVMLHHHLNSLEQSIQSIRQQIYPNYELCIFLDSGKEPPASLTKDIKVLRDFSLKDISGDFIVFIENGQILAPNALYEFANIINQDPYLDLIYADEDQQSSSGKRYHPFYKPDWSPDYLETFNYIAFPTCFRTSIAKDCFDNSSLYDMTLKFTEKTTKIKHIAKVLGHRINRKTNPDSLISESEKNIRALQNRLKRTGRLGTVYEHQRHKGCYWIEPTLKQFPLVSVIIPTAGKTIHIEGREIDLISNIVTQITNESTYKNIEIIVVDNGDLSDQQKQILADHGCQRITYTEPEFNIAKKLNLGVEHAKGELLLLMNDDIEIISPSWIEQMISHFEKPHVGVVGTKLLYPDGRIQHAGVVHNYGNPDHARRLFPKDEAGYFFSTCGTRNFMAVTGAVMMTLTSLYRKIGGYSEELAVSYNDVDYCLKVREKGLSIVYAPEVELIHMESQSRVPVANMKEVAWYHLRWAPQIVSDPYYNEQFLAVASPTFEPSVNQRVL